MPFDKKTLPQEIYTAYRKLKTHIYYDSTSLHLRKRFAEFEDALLYTQGQCEKEGTSETRQTLSESVIMEKFKGLAEEIINVLSGKADEVLEKWLGAIGHKTVIKNFHTPKCKSAIKDNGTFITNDIDKGQYVIDQYNALIDAPIELHIISVLWLMTIGKKLNPLVSRHNYAYRLSLHDRTDKIPIDPEENNEISGPESGLMLYEPYFIRYQQWRDNGIEKAKKALDSGENVVVLSLDIQRYFYSVRLNVMEEVDKYFKYIGQRQDNKNGDSDNLDSFEKRLCEILQLIHVAYYKNLRDTGFPGICRISDDELKDSDVAVPLPVGLPSSGFLGNLHLTPFDNFVQDMVIPAYYGRYVDDILMVFCGNKLRLESIDNPIESFIRRNLIRKEDINLIPGKKETKGINYWFLSTDVKPDDSKDSDATYYINTDHATLRIQQKKVIMEYFKSSESKAAINKFMKRLEKNRSEFRLLPFEERVNNEFDDEAFRLEYSDSINKLRSLQGISEDKYGASKYLAQKIFLSVLPFERDSESKRDMIDSAHQILTYFRGRTTLLMSSLWEKVATYFLINEDCANLMRFYNQAIEAIEHLDYRNINKETNEAILAKIRTDLHDYLDAAIAMAFSLDLKLIGHDKKLSGLSSVRTLAIKFRRSYMFRHSCLYMKGLCYTLSAEDVEAEILGKKLLKHRIGKIDTEIAPYLSPIFLQPHEIVLVQVFHRMTTHGDRHSVPQVKMKDKPADYFDWSESKVDMAAETRETFRLFNYKWRHCLLENGHTKFKHLVPDIEFNIYDDKRIDIGCLEIKDSFIDSEKSVALGSKEGFQTANRKVGIVNWKVDESDVKAPLKGHPNKSRQRRQDLFEVLNYAIKKGVELLVFPETSIPVEWLPLLVEQSARHDMAIVGGLEFMITPPEKESDREVTAAHHSGEVYNYSFGIFPVHMPYYTTTYPVLRKKNYYAPAEEELIRGNHYLLPDSERNPQYHLIHWRHNYFSIYNCFELSNISDRALMKSKVDYLIALEYNRDIPYFSNIVDSWARDLHCFIIQANPSHFGDSRVVQPTRSETKDILKVKGGDFPLVLVCTIAVGEIREFQRLGYNLQLSAEGGNRFKPVPACYEWQWAERRILNEPLSEEWVHEPEIIPLQNE